MTNPHCRCGYQAGSDDDLAAHLLAAFTSADGLGRDGRAHRSCESAAAGPPA